MTRKPATPASAATATALDGAADTVSSDVTATVLPRHRRAAEAFARLCAVMTRLRAPGGCPWDREQTYNSLKPYLIEETYEVVDAIEGGTAAEHCEELGDLLLQIVFQAEIAQETDSFDAAAVADAISDKLERRHPHVFGDAQAHSADGALAQWEAIKAEERPTKSSCLDGVPASLPALLRATRVGEKAAGLGFDWPDAAGAEAKVNEEWGELQAVMDGTDAETKRDASAKSARLHDELGDLLFAITNLARHLNIDAESALRHATGKFERRFRHMEHDLRQNGETTFKGASLATLEALWDAAKQRSAQDETGSSQANAPSPSNRSTAE